MYITVVIASGSVSKAHNLYMIWDMGSSLNTVVVIKNFSTR